MDLADEGHWNGMKRLVKFISSIRDKQLCIYPDGQDTWKLQVFNCSDYRGDNKTRRSVAEECYSIQKRNTSQSVRLLER
jgi:hypothetical protein